AVVLVGDNAAGLVLEVEGDDGAVHFAGHQLILTVNHETVGVIGLLDENRKLPPGIDLVNLLRRNVAEVDIALAVARRALGELEIGVQLPDRAYGAKAFDRLLPFPSVQGRQEASSQR